MSKVIWIHQVSNFLTYPHNIPQKQMW